jgi:putative transposase
MARSPRITIPTLPHHIVQRGNNRQAVFFDDDDYRLYLECLRLAKEKCACRVYAYVLMTNHVHILVEPSRERDLGCFMQSVGRRYVRCINAKYGRSGTLWEGRFKSAVVSRDEYLIVCSRYIERNPVRAGIVKHPWDYPWTSYHHRALGAADPLLDEDPWYTGLGSSPMERQKAYEAWVGSPIRDGELDQIRTATQRGRVIAGQEFQREIQARIGRRLLGESRGRRRKMRALTHEKVL